MQNFSATAFSERIVSVIVSRFLLNDQIVVYFLDSTILIICIKNLEVEELKMFQNLVEGGKKYKERSNNTARINHFKS